MVTLTQIKSPNFKYSKYFLISEHYAISLTGTRAVIMDLQFNLKHEIKGLYYVYKGDISPNEKWLLLVSNDNLFYVYSLDTFQLIKKQKMTGLYDYNLDGLGCFSFDGQKILILMMNSVSFRSVLRMYDIQDFTSYHDFYFDKRYLFFHMLPIPSRSEYLFEGIDKSNKDDTSKDVLVWFDGENYSAYTIDGYSDQVNVEYDEVKDRITLYGVMATRVVNREGKLIQVLSDGNSFSYFRGMDQNMSRSISEDLNDIMAVCQSSVYSFCYIGTGEGLLVYDPNSDKILFKKKILYGVHQIKELRSDLISVMTMNKNILFQVQNKP